MIHLLLQDKGKQIKKVGIENKKDVDFYVLKGILEEVLDFLGYTNRYSLVVDENKLPVELHPGQSAVISVIFFIY